MGRLGSGPLVIGLEPSAVFALEVWLRRCRSTCAIRFPYSFIARFFCCFFPSWPARRSAGGPSCLAPLRFFLT